MNASFDFNPFVKDIDLTIICPECGTKQSFNVIPPMPNFYADTHSESCNYDYEERSCEKCGFEFEIDLSCGTGGGDGTIENLPQENLLKYNENFDEDDYWDDIPENVYTDFLDPHVKGIAEILDKIDVLDEDARLILYRSLYAGIIGAFEAYLSDTLISRIMKNEEYKRKFVENSDKMEGQKFTLGQFYEVQESIDKLVVKRLHEILYHNLAVVSKLYKAVLNVEFPEYGSLAKSVSIRHDIVHRNGKDKKGNQVNITKSDVQDLAQSVSDFIKNLDGQIYEHEHSEEMKKQDKTLDEIFGTSEDI